MKYDIIQNTDRGKLIQLVNQAIEKGWMPLGGVAVVAKPEFTDTDLIYAQAIRK